MLSTEARGVYIEHSRNSSRIISVKLRGHHLNTTLIQVYTPASTHLDDEVEEFYEQLESKMKEWRYISHTRRKLITHITNKSSTCHPHHV